MNELELYAEILNSIQFFLGRNITVRMLKAYRLSIKREFDLNDEIIGSIFNFINSIQNEIKVEESSSDVVEIGHENNNDTAIFLFKSQSKGKFVVCVYDNNGKDYLPDPFFQLSDADEIVLFAAREEDAAAPDQPGGKDD